MKTKNETHTPESICRIAGDYMGKIIIHNAQGYKVNTNIYGTLRDEIGWEPISEAALIEIVAKAQEGR